MAQVSPDGSSVFGGIGPPGKTVILFNGDIIIAIPSKYNADI